MTPAALIRHRQALGFSQRRLAERLSVHPNTVYQWEHGREHGLRTISEDLAAHLAAVCAETPAAWAVLAYGTEALATFP